MHPEVTPGDTIYTILRHVSPSGMTRWLDLYAIRNGEPVRITYTVSDLTKFTYDRNRDALKVPGVGMDMGFHVVYTLSGVLFDGDGYALNHRWL